MTRRVREEMHVRLPEGVLGRIFDRVFERISEGTSGDNSERIPRRSKKMPRRIAELTYLLKLYPLIDILKEFCEF